MRRETPFTDIVRHLVPVLRRPPGDVRLRPGRHRAGLAHGRLPDQPAQRLLRGRGRARDDPQAADHQHPRRAARRGRPVPPAARDHRRREPLRRRQPAQAGHHLAGAGDDRGPGDRPGPHGRAPGGHAAGSQPRPDAAGRSSSCATGTKLTAVQLLWRYHEHGRALPARTGMPGSSTTTPRRSCGGGRPCSTGSSATRARRRARSTGSPSSRCCRATSTATAWTGPTRGCGRSTSSGPTCGPTRGCSTGCAAAGRFEELVADAEVARGRARAARGHPGLLPGQVPGEVPRPDRGRVVGLGHLRHAGPAVAAAGADAGAAPGHEGDRRDPCSTAARTPQPCCVSWPPHRVRVALGSIHRSPGQTPKREVTPCRARSRADHSAARTRPTRRPSPRPPPPEASARKENLDSDIDSVLDEIDGVLESNAEEFVRGFVQKGGQ